MLLPEIALVTIVHNRYWMEEWKDHIASYEVENLLVATNVYVAQRLSINIGIAM